MNFRLSPINLLSLRLIRIFHLFLFVSLSWRNGEPASFGFAVQSAWDVIQRLGHHSGGVELSGWSPPQAGSSGGRVFFVYTVISGMTAPRESRCKLGSKKVSPAHSRLRLMNLLYRVYTKAVVRAGGSAGHIFLRHAPALLGLQRRAACPPLNIITGRWEPRSPPGEPFRGAFGPRMSENRRETAPENSSRDPEIALDMVLRGVVLSDNDIYRILRNHFGRNRPPPSFPHRT